LIVLKRGAANWRNFRSPDRPDIADDARMLVIVRWLALYEITKDGVRIMRVVDAARNLGELDLSGE
jgi:toxin ParE1/3/4